jgi:hypothetical protein
MKKRTRKTRTDYPYVDLGPLPQPLPMPTNLPLDEGIERLVRVLRYNGVQTDQSCEGGKGHASPFPMVRFVGTLPEGYRALGIALDYGFSVKQLERVWYIEPSGEITGPLWQIILR